MTAPPVLPRLAIAPFPHLLSSLSLTSSHLPILLSLHMATSRLQLSYRFSCQAFQEAPGYESWNVRGEQNRDMVWKQTVN
ncbi:hypothetical protein E2C01_093625 [Portunus trituberculatus]|uniref:Uncharacterized protein n=1 Tax=Portunus trituberculatus TaxID=210409 RepID=A0A5B7K0Z0_PORTR|nr:hypothetical protein [Portunus trituberculatus]